MDPSPSSFWAERLAGGGSAQNGFRTPTRILRHRQTAEGAGREQRAASVARQGGVPEGVARRGDDAEPRKPGPPARPSRPARREAPRFASRSARAGSSAGPADVPPRRSPPRMPSPRPPRPASIRRVPSGRPRGRRGGGHDPRHGYATLLRAEGVHPVYVQESLGHASVQLSLDVYSHWMPSMGRNVADGIDAALAPDGAVGMRRRCQVVSLR